VELLTIGSLQPTVMTDEHSCTGTGHGDQYDFFFEIGDQYDCSKLQHNSTTSHAQASDRRCPAYKIVKAQPAMLQFSFYFPLVQWSTVQYICEGGIRRRAGRIHPCWNRTCNESLAAASHRQMVITRRLKPYGELCARTEIWKATRY